jgi:hypothetical protein
LVLLLLGLAEGNVLLSSLPVEAATAKLTFSELTVFGSLQDLFFLLCGDVIVVTTLLNAGTQLQGLGLPLGNLFLGLLFLQLLVNHLSTLHELLLLIGDQALILRIELLALLLEDLSAYVLVLGYTVRVKLPAATLTAHHQLGRVVLPDLNPVLTVHLLYALLLETVTLRLTTVTLRLTAAALLPLRRRRRLLRLL